MFHYLGNIEYIQLYLASIFFKILTEKWSYDYALHIKRINLNAKKIIVILE